MAASDRQTDNIVVRRLLESGHRFEFFQAMYLLERFLGDRAQIGYGKSCRDEGIKLRPDTSMGFPASEIMQIERLAARESGADRFRLTTTFMGLYGVDTPLPLHYASEICGLDSDEEHVRDFIDIIHHRVLSLFYRSWAKYRHYLTFRPDGSDPISNYMLCLAGLGPALRDENDAVDPVRYVRYVGLLTQWPHSAAGLGGILRDFFEDFRIEITQCVGRWIAVPDDQCNKMGENHCRMGIDLTVGERIFDRKTTFRATVGPMGFDDYASFLPAGSRFAQINELVRLYVVDPLSFQLELGLKKSDVPRCSMSSSDAGARLGWTSWLVSGEPEEDSYITLDITDRQAN